MSQLVSPAVVRSRANIASTNMDAVARITDAVSAATIHLEEMLNTTFAAGVGQSDVFYITHHDRPRVFDSIRVEFANGFVNGATAIVSKVDHHYSSVDAGTLLDNDYIAYDFERGFADFRHGDGGDHLGDNTYLQCTYDYGFAVTGDVFREVPAWLVEAATLKSLSLYKILTSCGTGSAAKGVDALDGLLARLLTRHARGVPYRFKPISPL